MLLSTPLNRGVRPAVQDAAFQAALAANRARDAELKKIAEERERVEKGAAALAERKRNEREAWEVRASTIEFSRKLEKVEFDQGQMGCPDKRGCLAFIPVR